MKKMLILIVLLQLYFMYSSKAQGYECCACYPANDSSQDSWDLKPYNPYADTVIITNPYGAE